MFYGLGSDETVVEKVVTLLAYGCPAQAIVAAFKLDERTVKDWQQRASVHSQAVHEEHLKPLNLEQVQADERRIKLQGKQVVWGAMAIMVSTGLGLGAVVSAHRNSTLITHLAQLVRRWAKRLALFITFDGFAAYRDAFEQAFADQQKRPRGRPAKCVWSCLTLLRSSHTKLKVNCG